MGKMISLYLLSDQKTHKISHTEVADTLIAFTELLTRTPSTCMRASKEVKFADESYREMQIR